MNEQEVTKKMLEDLVVKFNKYIVDKTDQLPTGKKKGETRDVLKDEIVDTCNELLQEGDEKFFTKKDAEILRAIGVDYDGLVGTDASSDDEKEQETVDDEEIVDNEEQEVDEKVVDEATEDEAITEDVVEEQEQEQEPEKEKPAKKTGGQRGRGKKKNATEKNADKDKKSKPEKAVPASAGKGRGHRINFDPTKSNKAKVYLAWKNGQEDQQKLYKLVKGAVKENTIKGWINAWKNDKNLPAVAKV